MIREEVVKTLADHRPELTELGVKSLRLFGSVARDDADSQSDVDFLVEFNRPIGLFHFIEVEQRLAEWLGCSVDLLTRDQIRPHLQEEILKDAIDAF
jgi:predicted nucleotidyltransferase